jgi:hypothetical protein
MVALEMGNGGVCCLLLVAAPDSKARNPNIDEIEIFRFDKINRTATKLVACKAT